MRTARSAHGRPRHHIARHVYLLLPRAERRSREHGLGGSRRRDNDSELFSGEGGRALRALRASAFEPYGVTIGFPPAAEMPRWRQRNRRAAKILRLGVARRP